MILDTRQRLGHALHEGLTADEPNFRVQSGLTNKMLPAPEAYLQPDVAIIPEHV